MTVKLDKSVKDKLIQQLSHPYGRVSLLCDGRRITLAVEQFKPLKYFIGIYIDEVFKGRWLFKEQNHPETKYLYVKTKALFSAAEKAKLIKIFGVRSAKKNFELDKKSSSLMSYFPNGRMAINHLCKVCDSIELIEETAKLIALENILEEPV